MTGFFFRTKKLVNKNENKILTLFKVDLKFNYKFVSIVTSKNIKQMFHDILYNVSQTSSSNETDHQMFIISKEVSRH